MSKCMGSGKVQFFSQKAAKSALKRIASSPRDASNYPKYYYECPYCLAYHLTKARQIKMEEHEKEAYLYGAAMGAEYLVEIGKTDLAEMTPHEALVFSECMCKNYHTKYAELISKIV